MNRKKFCSKKCADPGRALDVHAKVVNLPTRKEQAIMIKEIAGNVAGVVFNILDNKDIEKGIWKMCKPRYELPFKTEL